MDRRTLTRSLLAASAAGVALPGALRAQTPSASPAASSGNIRIAEVPGIALTLSPDGTMLAGIGDDERFYVWDAESFETIARSEPTPEIPIIDHQSVMWAPDSTALAWSLDAARLWRDSDIYVFDIDTGQITNLTDDEPVDEDAVKLPLGGDPVSPMDVDMYPSWNDDGEDIFFARTVWEDASEIATSLWRISRDGGEATQIGVLAPDAPFLVSSIHAGMEDGSVLYATWPTYPDSPHHGVFLVTPDGEVEGISTGMLARSTRNMVLMSVAPSARKAVLVVTANYARLEGPVWIEMDLDTGVPTPFEEIFGLAQTPVETAREGAALFGAPAFLTDTDGSLEGYLYVTRSQSRERESFALWHYDASLGEADQLGTFGFGDTEPRGGVRYERIELGANGTAAYFHRGTAWLTSIDQ